MVGTPAPRRTPKVLAFLIYTQKKAPPKWKRLLFERVGLSYFLSTQRAMLRTVHSSSLPPILVLTVAPGSLPRSA